MKATLKQYMKLIRICMDKNHFTFRGEYYKELNEPRFLFPSINEMKMKLISDGKAYG